MLFLQDIDMFIYTYEFALARISNKKIDSRKQNSRTHNDSSIKTKFTDHEADATGVRRQKGAVTQIPSIATHPCSIFVCCAPAGPEPTDHPRPDLNTGSSPH
jgi:hypothetical protein